MSFPLPPEAYSFTPRLRQWMADADPTIGMIEYGLGGTVYAKARDLAEKENRARAWQELNAPVLFEGSTPIPDVDAKETRPNIDAGKNYARPRWWTFR